MAQTSAAATGRVALPSVGYLVWHLSLRWQAQLSDELRPLGITPAEYAVLAHLHALSASGLRPSQRELADVSGLEPMYVSKLVRSLEGTGLVARAQHPDDPRAIQLSLTRRGTRAVSEGRRIADQLDQRRLATFGGAASGQAAQLKASLQVLLREAEAAHHPFASISSTPQFPRKEAQP
jgi:MarR family transcriptional regulator, organic hydroperoxide resistance regulator